MLRELMARPLGAIVTGMALMLLGTALAGNAGATSSASRVVDRTFSCQAGFVGGLHQVDVTATFSTDPSSKLRASATVAHGLHAVVGHATSDGLTVHRQLCTPSRARVMLSTKRLRGGGVPPLGVERTCETPRRVLLRIRGIFERPVTASVSRQFGFPQLTALGDVRRAEIALATPAGRTIAYASVTGAETARLFTLPTCKED